MMNFKIPLPEIPSCAWQRAIGLGWENPYTVRYASNLDDGPWHGMPLGGLGAGCIGRSHRGDFNLWHIDGGEHIFRSLPACQFSIFEQPEGEEAQVYALSTEAPEDGSLSRWTWYPPEKGSYHALYPRSWFKYEGVFKSEIICEQFSPIWPNCYQESSYPVGIFEWTVHNPTDKPITLSILWTWQNTVGWFANAVKKPTVTVRDDGSPVYDYQPKWGDSMGNYNQWITDNYRVGCLFNRVRPHEELQEGEGQMAIASIINPALEAFYHTRWNPSGDGSEIWDHFAMDGSLPDKQDETPASPGEQIAGAFAIRFTIRPGKTRKIPFILSWDFPVTEFAEGVNYYRRHTDFFARTGNNAWTVVRTALKHGDVWREKIQNWQQPIIQRTDLPDWFKMALFNELYLLVDGGTLWTAATENDPVGQFGVLECIDYRWYESLDVRLYGSFATLMLFPRLDKAVLEAFARAIPTGDDTPRVIGYNNAPAIRKAAGATPHDLGAPNEHPWEKTNYTSYQDCNQWKDLPADFVLQVYRDYRLTGETDIAFLWECWAAIPVTLHYLKGFDLDGDGIPENSGAPDQTFDDWQLRGVSAYCGGLWIAALEAAIAIAAILRQNPPQNPDLEPPNYPTCLEEEIRTYQTWLDQSRPIYLEKLWNGEYFRLDSESGSDVVMADQMCGQFYAQLLGLPDVVAPEYAESALKKVYDACFLKFHNGQFGAANGLRPDGSPLNPNDTHPLEVWTGINFGLAAYLIHSGMKAEGMKLTEQVVKQVYENGLQFRTPEAITAVGTFRASHYLRALAIWGIYGVLTDFC
ncbi:bile acid beta-glucosidase [Spirulina subsalsa FACHB-351]|uniref:Bile acid beta-glucosidase n=2 Tax=Spirulina subsalsa TaxID=54311 RepID=A0ABT3L9V6_9CYAN|nr:GH116 family glycosyl hydrolase [Spirulina subsalsa]MCW6038296.1 bile acid beta-glucosidase [Spirulina subsalsa FACHB-351]